MKEISNIMIWTSHAIYDIKHIKSYALFISYQISYNLFQIAYISFDIYFHFANKIPTTSRVIT